MSTILGMRGTGSWDTESVPGSYREAMLRLFPGGSMPITGILSKTPSKKIDSEKHNWQIKNFPMKGGAVTSIYTDSLMTVAYVSGGVAGTVLYVKVPLATAYHFRKGHQALLRYTADPTLDVNAEVMQVERNGANSKLTISLLEADDNSTSNYLAACDYIKVIGNVNAQGGTAPVPISYNPTWYYNYTQITRTSLWLTRTAIRTKLRGPNAYTEAKSEALDMHGTELESNLLWSVLHQGTGDNGEPKNTSMGMIPFIKEFASTNVNDYTLNADFSGKTWLEGGADWFDSYLYKVFQFGDTNERAMVVGDGALAGINKLAQYMGHLVTNTKDTTFGLAITTWKMPRGTVHLLTHPLFNLGDTTDYYTGLIFDPKNVTFCYIDDTTYYPDKGMQSGNGQARQDALSEEYLTEATYEFHFPETFALLTGIGKDNDL